MFRWPGHFAGDGAMPAKPLQPLPGCLAYTFACPVARAQYATITIRYDLAPTEEGEESAHFIACPRPDSRTCDFRRIRGSPTWANTCERGPSEVGPGLCSGPLSKIGGCGTGGKAP